MRVSLVALLLASLLGPSLRATTEPATTMPGLIDAVEPNIVSIRVKRVKDLPEAPLSRGLRQFLRTLPDEDRRDLVDYRRRPDAPFTGLLIDAEGHVLTTNYNVLETVEDVRVRLNASHEVDAKILARAPHDDLALLKLEGGVPDGVTVPGIRWANTPAFRAGRYVLAMGRAPDPSRVTLTLGIISSPVRNYGRLFQTDAALNYGNVGGPLVGLDGTIFGLAAFVGHVYVEWGFNSGVGFGVRADRIREILPAMKRGEDIAHPETPFLGVGAADNSENPNLFGARIGQVLDDSAAGAAGVKSNDVVVEWQGEAVYDFMHLRHLIFQQKAGATVNVVVKRGEEKVPLEITLGRRVPEYAPRWHRWRRDE